MNVTFLENGILEPIRRKKWIPHLIGGKIFETKYMMLSEISPFMSMVLHNEDYLFLECLSGESLEPVTSEEVEFASKWKQLISEYGSNNMGSILAEKLATQISKYGISLFSPCVSFLYFANVLQLQIVLNKIKNFIDSYNVINRENLDSFIVKVLHDFEEFYNQFGELFYRRKVGNLNLFESSNGKNGLLKFLRYNDKETFKAILDLQDLVKSKYEINITTGEELKASFYIPGIVLNYDELKKEWLNDFNLLKDNYPLACIVEYSEKGLIEVCLDKFKTKLKNLFIGCC